MIKAEIIKAAKDLGIEQVGFAPGAVVALFPYFVKGEAGNISLYARGIDYHIVAEEKLKMLSMVLLQNGAERVDIHVDKGGLDDRKAAYEAGLGFLGMNGMLICDKYGSYFFIGQILHDLNIEPDIPDERGCLMCGRCERACPGKALAGGKVDISKCLSDITQRRGELTDDEKNLMKKTGVCWGCDVCQKVCPHNQGLETVAVPEFLEDRITSLSFADIDGLSNREFKEKYGRYAFSWRGKSVILRNLKILDEED
jgi:epoxyqueuosine reductase QueG